MARGGRRQPGGDRTGVLPERIREEVGEGGLEENDADEERGGDRGRDDEDACAREALGVVPRRDGNNLIFRHGPRQSTENLPRWNYRLGGRA